jgi:hypothetical protein
MLIKVDLPISIVSANNQLHPVLHFYLIKYFPDFWDVKHTGTRVSYFPESYIVVKKACLSKLQIYNLYNGRLVYVPESFLIRSELNIPMSTQISWGNTVWRRLDTFQQNDLSLQPRVIEFVNQHLRSLTSLGISKDTTLLGLGGEFYVYFIQNKGYYSNFQGFSNNQHIVEIANANCAVHLPTLSYRNRLVNYEHINKVTGDTNHNSVLLINLAHVPFSVFEMLTKKQFEKVIIITCHLSSFNKRRHIIEQSNDYNFDFEFSKSRTSNKFSDFSKSRTSNKFSNYKLVSFTHLTGNTAATVSIFVYQCR